MKITIQGHPTRGKEVIQILESLGGKNTSNHNGEDNYAYYISSINNHICKTSLLFSEYAHYTLEEFEKEFPFKVGDKVIDHEGDVAIITEFAYIEEKLGYSLQYENGRGTATPGILKPYKEMKEERNITLTLEKAKEWYKKGGELKEIALQAFTEMELNPLPRSWEEFCENYPVKKGECIIESEDRISVSPWAINVRRLKTWIPSKKSAEAHLAMIQLEQLRNCWWNGWEPEYRSTTYVIKRSNNEIRVIQAYSVSAFLSFPTKEMAEEFLKCFKDLIEKAGDLI